MMRRLPEVYTLVYNDKILSRTRGYSMIRAVPFLLVAMLLALSGCGDDGVAPADGFEVLVRVVDLEGNPVAGLELLVLMDSPYYQDGLAAEKAAVVCGWDQPIAGAVRVTIEDAAGALVRELVTPDEPRPAGSHRVQWNGLDAAGGHQPSGLYWMRLVAFQADTVVYDAREPMYMALMDFERARLDTTDGAGRIRLTDQRMFPLLYGQVDMQARDETAEIIGEFPLVPLMRFYLRDPRYGHVERFDRNVTRSGQIVVLDWMGVDARAATEAESGKAVRMPGPVRPQPPETGFRLIPPFPNPFN